MESLTARQIASHIGVTNLDDVRGTQDWRPDTHAHLLISELVVGEEIIPFRVRNSATGETHTRIKTENHILDHERVKAIHADTLAMNQKKNREIMPEVLRAVPELDPDKRDQFVQFGDRVFDLVDGRLVNPRPIPQHPFYSVSGTEIRVDASDMADHHQTAIAKALAGKAKVIAPRAGS